MTVLQWHPLDVQVLQGLAHTVCRSTAWMRAALVSVMKRRAAGSPSNSSRAQRSAGTQTRSPVAAAMAARSSSACGRCSVRPAWQRDGQQQSPELCLHARALASGRHCRCKKLLCMHGMLVPHKTGRY